MCRIFGDTWFSQTSEHTLGHTSLSNASRATSQIRRVFGPPRLLVFHSIIERLNVIWCELVHTPRSGVWIRLFQECPLLPLEVMRARRTSAVPKGIAVVLDEAEAHVRFPAKIAIDSVESW